MNQLTSTTHRQSHAVQSNDQFSRERIETWKRIYCRGASDLEAMQFIETARRTKLSPESRHIFMVPRWDSKERRMTSTPQVSIDGLRLIAQRTGVYGGQEGPYWCGSDKQWTDVWLESTPPLAAKVAVIRKDWNQPLWAVANWDAYCQTDKSGNPTAMWRKMGPLMLAKCAEALALRKAFPGEMGGLYTDDEMAQSHAPAPQPQHHTPRVQAIPEPSRAEKMMQKFAKYQVNRYWLEDQVGGKDLDEFTPEDFDQLCNIWRRLEAGEVTVEQLSPYQSPQVHDVPSEVEQNPTTVEATDIDDLFGDVSVQQS